ncbi:MAG: hypothetical protein KDB07_13560 [Planctomycetes bacterium]|nr:hypothetical protein [Planctomycetota bacterium]
MKALLIALFACTLCACSSGPTTDDRLDPMPLGQATRSIEEVVSYYAFSAKEMHVEFKRDGSADLRWQDQVHDKHNRMSWVPRKQTVRKSDSVSGISRDKHGFKVVLTGQGEESAFIAENEARAQQLRRALRSLIDHLAKAAPTS